MSMDENRSRMERWLARHHNQRHLIALQDFPDSDAIISAAAHQKLASGFFIKNDIVIVGKLTLPHVQALADLLGIYLMKFDGELELSGYDGVIYLNDPRLTNMALRQAQVEAGLPTLLIVGHASNTLLEEAECIVIPEGKATSSMYANYLRSSTDQHFLWDPVYGSTEFESSHAPSADEDVEADTPPSSSRQNRPFASARNRTGNAAMAYSTSVMEVIRRALTTRASHNDLSAAGVGYLAAKDIDALPIAAELLTRENTIRRSIVFAIVRDMAPKEQLYGVYWRNSEDADPTPFLRSIFKEESGEATFHSVGRFAGIFSIPLGPSSRKLTQETQMMQWSYYEILTLKKIADTLLSTPD